MDRREFLRASALTTLVPLLGACGDDKPTTGTFPTPSPGTALENVGLGRARGLQVIDAEAELIVGASRYAFGLLDPNGAPVTDATVRVYVGRSASAPPITVVSATQLREGVGDKALYVAKVPFPQDGDWLVAVTADTSEDAGLVGGTRVTVKKSSKSPMPGQRAISVATPTTAAPGGADPLCSRNPVCSMHTLSLDAALRNGKPTVVTFSAPAFCQTEVCGPVVDIVDRIGKERADAMNFIHVEAYRQRGKVLAPALTGWKFDSEPWTYFIDKVGIVSDRISGALGAEEVTERVSALA